MACQTGSYMEMVPNMELLNSEPRQFLRGRRGQILAQAVPERLHSIAGTASRKICGLQHLVESMCRHSKQGSETRVELSMQEGLLKTCDAHVRGEQVCRQGHGANPSGSCTETDAALSAV